VARKPVETLKEHGITITSDDDLAIAPMIPPKHVFEEALLNIAEASEFASEEGFESPDMFAFWLFVVFVAT
jgi:hypothetical protein